MSDEKDVSEMTKEEATAKLLEVLERVKGMKEDEFRSAIVVDYNTMAVAIAIANKNFKAIIAWQEAMGKRMTLIEEKLSFLENVAKNDDPKNQRNWYLQ